MDIFNFSEETKEIVKGQFCKTTHHAISSYEEFIEEQLSKTIHHMNSSYMVEECKETYTPSNTYKNTTVKNIENESKDKKK